MWIVDLIRSKIPVVKKDVDAAQSLATDWESSGIMGAFFAFFKGRHTTFAIAFLVIGTILALRGKLDANFVALAGVIQTLVTLHSVNADYHARQMAKSDDDDDPAPAK